MKLSKDTLDILKNFSTISPHLHIKKGNILVALNSPVDSFFARAVVAEEFPYAMPIYDMNEFLAILSLIPNADFEFGEKSVMVSDGVKSIEYIYADKFMVPETPEVRLTPEKVVLSCTMKHNVFDTTLRAALLLNVPRCLITGKNGEAVLSVGKTNVSNKNHSFKHVLGACTDEFQYIFALDHLKVLPDTYEVVLGSRGTGDDAQGIMHMKGKTNYWLAADPDSTL